MRTSLLAIALAAAAAIALIAWLVPASVWTGSLLVLLVALLLALRAWRVSTRRT